jgi:hypothetical protein
MRLLSAPRFKTMPDNKLHLNRHSRDGGDDEQKI